MTEERTRMLGRRSDPARRGTRIRPGTITVIGLLLLAILGVPGRSCYAAGPNRPNLVLIVADDLGYAELGCQGAADVRTPHIDSIARHGVWQVGR
jgi:hypothetical protein